MRSRDCRQAGGLGERLCRVGFIVVMGMVLCGQVSGMEMGTNFWNLGWHAPGDCFRDVRNVAGENPWNRQFLKEISMYRSFRFMDWDQTNNSERQAWNERTAKDAANQNPAAYEWMIDLCNRMNADMWVTLPHRSVSRETGDRPSDYALRLCLLVKTGVDMGRVDLAGMLDTLSGLDAAELVKAGGVKTCQPLKPELKLYVEYSNETWNGMFKQSHYCCDEGIALGLNKDRWTAGFRYHAWAAIRVFRAAELVFGKDSARVVRVLATQSANAWIAGQHLEVMNDATLNPWKVKADAIATAPYFGHNVTGDSPEAAAELRAAIRESAEQSSRHKEIADKNGLTLIAYEGGQHVYKKAAGINRSAVMYELYGEYLAEMEKYYTHFSHYCHVGQADDGGAWGCIEYTGQPLGEAPKYRSLVDYVKKNEPEDK